MVKPDYSATEAVPFRFGRKKQDTVSNAGHPADTVPLNLKRKSLDVTSTKPMALVLQISLMILMSLFSMGRMRRRRMMSL
jgi:hypothetical protein